MLKERIAVAVEKGPTDILAEDTPVLVLLDKMLPEARPQLVLARMRADTDYPVSFVTGFALLEKNVDSGIRNPGLIKGEGKPLPSAKQAVNLLAYRTHTDTCLLRNWSCSPILRPRSGISME